MKARRVGSIAGRGPRPCCRQRPQVAADAASERIDRRDVGDNRDQLYVSAIFDVLQVPIWGRESDGADRLAALIMTQFGEDVAQTTIVGTAQLFMWSNKKWTGSDFAAANSPDYQRFFNYVCVAYAASPLQFGGLVDNGILPKHRAERCDGEYAQIRKAFDLRIMPYVDPDLLIKVRSTPWLSWTPAKQ